jgi:hypothetical protein
MFLDENCFSLSDIWNRGLFYFCSISASGYSGISNPDSGSTLRGSDAKTRSTHSISTYACSFTANYGSFSHSSWFSAFYEKAVCASPFHFANTTTHNANNATSFRSGSGSALCTNGRARTSRNSFCHSNGSACSTDKTGFFSDRFRGGLQF